MLPLLIPIQKIQIPEFLLSYGHLIQGGFTRRAKAGDYNKQTADDVKKAMPRPFTRTR